MTVVVSLLKGPVTRPLPPPYAGVTVTLRRLRSPEWQSAYEAAMTTLRDDAALLNLLVEHDLLPDGSVKRWKRMKDFEPLEYAEFLAGVGQWLSAVECSLKGLVEWKGLSLLGGAPAPVTREVLEVLLLDDALRGAVMSVLTEAGRLLIVEGEPSGASLNGSSEPARTA